MNTRYFSFIIGAGPSGLCSALNLAKHNMSFEIIDKEKTPSTKNRAIGLQKDTLELFQKHSLYNSVKAHSTIIYGSRIYWNNKPASFISFPDPKNNFSTNQQYLEELLLHTLNREYGVHVTRGKEIHASHNQITDKQISAKPNLVLICSGAKDPLPGELGFKKNLFANNEVSFSCDANIAPETLNHSFMHQMIYMDGRVVFTPLPQKNLFKVTGTYRITDQKLPVPSTAELHRLIESKTFITLQDVENISLYRLQASQAHLYAYNNIFLVGDAAQTFLPHGAFGLNTAMQQAFNLTDMIVQSANIKKIHQDYHDTWKKEVKKRLSISRDLATKVSPQRLINQHKQNIYS